MCCVIVYNIIIGTDSIFIYDGKKRRGGLAGIRDKGRGKEGRERKGGKEGGREDGWIEEGKLRVSPVQQRHVYVCK